MLKGSVWMCLFGLMISCSPTIKVTNSWKNPDPTLQGKTYHSVFIAALTENQNARMIVEDNLARAAEARGMKTTKSGAVFAPTFSQKNVPDKDVMLKQVRESGCDLIFTVALTNKEDQNRYVPGNTFTPYVGYGSSLSFSGYYGTVSGPIYSPGYYTSDKIYYLESNLFDAASEKVLWSAQSQAVNPTDLEHFSQTYTEAVIGQLKKDGLIKK